jgi:hypothetical protein
MSQLRVLAGAIKSTAAAQSGCGFFFGQPLKTGSRAERVILSFSLCVLPACEARLKPLKALQPPRAAAGFSLDIYFLNTLPGNVIAALSGTSQGNYRERLPYFINYC